MNSKKCTQALLGNLILVGFSTFFFTNCTKSTPIDNPLEDAVVNQAKKKITVGIGEIVSINQEQRFVLIEVTKPKQASKAVSYYIEKPGRTVVLRPTGEQIRKYIAADIVSGTAKLGDPVLVEIHKPTPPPAPVTPPTPQQPEIPEEVAVEPVETTPDSETIQEKVQEVQEKITLPVAPSVTEGEIPIISPNIEIQ